MGSKPPIQPMEQPKTSIGGVLTAVVGVAAAAGLLISVPQDEGTRYVPYFDSVKILTVCNGDTENVVAGVRETPESCQRRLERQLVRHARGVMACTPRLAQPGRDNQRWAAVSLAYNIGVGAYCKSSIDRHFDRGEWRAGCDRFLVWNKAGGRVIRGLTERRKRERAICLRGLA
jgi:lysozyme